MKLDDLIAEIEQAEKELVGQTALATKALTDTGDLDLALQRTPGNVLHFEMLAVKMRGVADTAVMQCESIESALNAHYRKTFVASGEKFTEGSVTTAVKNDSRYMKAQRVMARARQVHRTAEAIAKAVSTSKDTLINIAKVRMKEMDVGIRLTHQGDDGERKARTEELKGRYKRPVNQDDETSPVVK